MSGATRLKYAARLISGGTPAVDDERYWTDDQDSSAWVAIADMTRSSVITETARRVTRPGVASKGLHVGKPGTVLFAMYASIGETAVLGCEATWNQAILGIEPIPGRADARFIRYWLAHSKPELSKLFRSNTQDNLNAEQVSNLPFPTHTRRTQARIADFLDAETARIDALITKKRRLLKLLEEKHWSFFVGQIGAALYHETLLRRLISQITDGPFGSALKSEHYVDSGARVVRLGNIGASKFRPDDKAFIDLSYYQTLTKHGVDAGDLLIAGLGDANNHVGRACVAPELGPAIVKADCYAAKVRHDLVLPEFLALFLSSPLGAAAVAQAARGTTRSRINLDIVKDVLLPVPGISEQERIVEAHSSQQRTCGLLAERLNAQGLLLREHRQALITAAVTGRLDVEELARGGAATGRERQSPSAAVPRDGRRQRG